MPAVSAPITAVTMAIPVGANGLLIPLVAGVGGAIILLLFVIIFIICCWAICYRKKGIYDVQVRGGGRGGGGGRMKERTEVRGRGGRWDRV